MYPFRQKLCEVCQPAVVLQPLWSRWSALMSDVEARDHLAMIIPAFPIPFRMQEREKSLHAAAWGAEEADFLGHCRKWVTFGWHLRGAVPPRRCRSATAAPRHQCPPPQPPGFPFCAVNREPPGWNNPRLPGTADLGPGLVPFCAGCPKPQPGLVPDCPRIHTSTYFLYLKDAGGQRAGAVCLALGFLAQAPLPLAKKERNV